MSDSFDYDLVCIGSGPTGQRAAVQAAKLGHRTAVVEKRRAVGGVCIDTGTIPSKTLREAVVITFSGIHPAHPPWIRADGEVILNTDDVVKLKQLPRTLAVVGADERGRMTVDDCFRTTVPNITVFNDPTLAECYKVAALDASNTLTY